MKIASHIAATLASPLNGVIRKMFEDGAALKKQYGDDKVFDFSLGNPDLDPPPAVTAAIERLAAENPRGIHGYMPNAGYPAARAAMAAKTSREQGVPVTGDQVVMCAGAAAAMNCVLKAVVSPRDEVLVCAPFFPEYKHYAANHGAVLHPVAPGPAFGLNVAGIADALSRGAEALPPKTAAVIVNSPNNPSGRVYAAEDLKALAAVLIAHGGKTGRPPLLILDEPYRDILYGGVTVPPVFPLYSESVVVTSFAKNLSLPGERIGYLAANPAMTDVNAFVAACIFANRVLGFVNASAFFQRVVTAAWDAPADYSAYTERRNAIMAAMDEAGYEYAVPEGAFYLFAKVPDGGDDLEFCNHLKTHLVLCAPGTGFGAPGWFRAAYCVSPQTITNCVPAFKQARETWKNQ